MKPSLYIETTVPSYYVSRDSRDVVVLAHQQITRVWWETRLADFRSYISPVVLAEAGEGDPEQARKRMEVLVQFQILEAGEAVEKLSAQYMAEFGLPGSAIPAIPSLPLSSFAAASTSSHDCGAFRLFAAKTSVR